MCYTETKVTGKHYIGATLVTIFSIWYSRFCVALAEVRTSRPSDSFLSLALAFGDQCLGE